MGLRIYVKFEGEATFTEITQYVASESVSFDINLCNDKFKAVQDSVKMRTIYDKSLNQKFFSASDWLPAYITNDQEIPTLYGWEHDNTIGYPGNEYGYLGIGRVFTGAIFPSEKDKLRDFCDEGVSFEIVDNNYRLEKDALQYSIPEHIDDVWYVYNPSNVSRSFVHQLLINAGFLLSEIDSSVSVLTTLAPIVIKGDKDTYFKIISDLLYEHHVVHYFDANGTFKLYDWKHDSVTLVGSIDESGIHDAQGIRRSRNILDYNGYELEYSPTQMKSNALVYRENLDVEGKLLLPDQTVPTKGEQKEVYQSFSTNWISDEADILFSSNHKLELTKDDGINVVVEEYEVDKSRVVLKNETLDDLRLYQFDVRADVIYTEGSEKITLPKTTAKKEKYQFKYVRTYEDAYDFGNALYNNMLKYGKHKYEFETEAKYEIGTAYTLETRDYVVDVLIVGKSYNSYKMIYTYTCFGVGNAVLQEDETSQTIPSQVPSYDQTIDPQIRLSKKPENVIVTARGLLKTNEVLIEARLYGVDGTIVWSCTNGTIEELEIGDGVFDNKIIVLDGSTVTEDYTVVTASIMVGGINHYNSITIDRIVVGDTSPVYMGALQEIPVDMQSEPLIQGDHFLWIGEYIGNNPENDPNNEDSTPEELEEARQITASLSAESEYIPGRMYAWNGVQWGESRDSAHLGNAYVDALKIAKDSDLWIYASVIVAQLGLFQDLLVGNTLKSVNYAENESGEPTKGFLLDGPNDVIKAYAMEAYNSKFFGTVESTGFKTITGTDAKNIGVANVAKNLYKYSDMFDLVADNESFVMKSGVVEGFSFDRLTKRNNARILMGSHGYESKTISAQQAHWFTKVFPDTYFGRTFYYSAKGYYKGVLSTRLIARVRHDGSWADFLRPSNGSYSVSGTQALESYDGMMIGHGSAALWGSQSTYVDYLKLYTVETFSGLVLRNGNSSHIVVSPKPNAYYYNTKTFTIGAETQNTLARHYVSGTDFYDLFSALPDTADGFLNSGKIKVRHIDGSLNEYAVSRLVKDANGIDFYTGSGIVRVNKFVNGTSTGVYDHLEISEAIAFQSVPDGVEVKSVLPWGTLAGNTENVVIGTIESRFEAAYLKYLDILNNLDVGGNITTLGKLIGATINTGDGNYKIGQDLRPTDSPTFATINTGYGANEVYRMTYESVSMFANNDQAITLSSMPYVGEVKFVYVHVSFKNYEKRLYLPSGGTYFVTGLARNGDSYSSWNKLLESRSTPYHGPNAGIFGGGTSLFYNNSDDTVYVLYIIRRVA